MRKNASQIAAGEAGQGVDVVALRSQAVQEWFGEEAMEREGEAYIDACDRKYAG